MPAFGHLVSRVFGSGLGMTRFWMKAVLALLLGGGMPVGAQAAWYQAQTRHFTVYSEGNDEKLRGFAERLEKFDFLLRRLTGVNSPDKGSPVKVYLLSNEGKVKELARNPNIAGYYTTSDRTAYAFLARGAKTGMYDTGAEEILFHEYTHHFMLHHFPAAYPAWYVEGFAEFFSVVEFPKDGSIQFAKVPMGRVPGLVQGQPYPLAQLLSRTTDGLNLRDGDRYYGTAWLLTHYYFQNKNDYTTGMTRYLNDLAQGKPDVKPDDYFEGGLAGLEKVLKAYMSERLYISVLKPQEMNIGAVTVVPVDPAQGALMEDELHLINHPKSEEIPALVASIRTTAAKYPGNAYALALLAEAEWDAEEADAALADADRAIAIDPQSSRAYAVRAEALLARAQDSDKEEDWKAALTSIVRANRADTEDPVPLALFYRYHAMRGGKMPDIGYDGLYKAFTLLPQNPNYRFQIARAMAFRGEYEAASILLDPIAFSPHGSEMREAAIRMKADYDAQAAKKKPVAPAGSPAPAA
jgi:tetratricopeptide (TPR) repeat protein